MYQFFFLLFRLIVILNIQVFTLIKDYYTFTIIYIIYMLFIIIRGSLKYIIIIIDFQCTQK